MNWKWSLLLLAAILIIVFSWKKIKLLVKEYRAPDGTALVDPTKPYSYSTNPSVVITSDYNN